MFAKYEERCAKDKASIEAMVQALEGSGKPFIVSAGALAFQVPDGESIEEIPAIHDLPEPPRTLGLSL